MPTIVAVKSADNPLGRAVRDLRAGKPVAIPTETVYGLAADATNGEAVARVFAMKGRPSFNPLICHVDGLVMAHEVGLIEPAALELANAFWPGPLTMVVPARRESGLSELVTAGLGTVGLRCPAGFARDIISALGRPLAAPSANRSGRISPTSAGHVAGEYEGEELLVIDGGPCPVGVESTIVKITGNTITLLRPGAVTAGEIEAVTGITPSLPQSDAPIQAPGMLASHYAPDAAVRLNCTSCNDGDAWLGFGNLVAPQNAAISINLSAESNLVEAAANLYGHLKKLDSGKAATICVAPIPMEGLGIAINDRLSRAAAPRPKTANETANKAAQ